MTIAHLWKVAILCQGIDFDLMCKVGDDVRPEVVIIQSLSGFNCLLLSKLSN